MNEDVVKAYHDYWDWYDNGPGSENWKRKLEKDMARKLTIKHRMGFPWEKVYEDLEKEMPKKVKLPEELFEI